MDNKASVKTWMLTSTMLIVLLTPVIATGKTIYVDASKDGDGSSWANARKYLQDGLADAAGGDEIWVAQGTYKPDASLADPNGSGDRTATFGLINGIEVYGGFPAGGGLWGDRDAGTYPTILSGDLNGDDVGFTNNGDNSRHIVTTSYVDPNTVLDGFTITAGNADGSGSDGYGGAVSNYQSSPTIKNCTFTTNAATKRGGAVFNKQSGPMVTNCIFSGNSAVNAGGAMYNQNSAPAVKNCVFTGNSTGNFGGAIHNGSNSSATIINCTFTANSAYNASGYGGGLANDLSSSTVTNCIFWANTAANGPQVSLQSSSSASISYCDLQGSQPDVYYDGSSSVTWGSGNIADDPQLQPDNYHLQAGSPCVSAGDPNGYYNGQTDIDGEPRVMGTYVEIGCDEVLPSPCYVDDDAPGDPAPGDPDISDPLEDGSQAHPFDSIQEAVDAMDGNAVIVLDGTYTGTGNHDIDFAGKAITVRSLNGSANCVIDCQAAGRGFDFHSGETQQSILMGFTIRNGWADYGGAIRCDNSSPQIQNCVIIANTATVQGGGLYCNLASPVLADCTFTNNSPDGIWVQGNSPLIVGTVQIISNNLTGNGTLQLDPGATMHMRDSAIDCNLSGPGTVQVDIDTELVIAGNAVIDLADSNDPNANGQIQCEGPLTVQDNAQIINTNLNVTVASFEDNTSITNSVITVDAAAPYGQLFLADNVTCAYNRINSNGDRYINLEPSTYVGVMQDNQLFITGTEGVNQAQGGVFEARAEDGLVGHSCDPCEFMCQVAPGTIPDCNLRTWTIERLELIADAKMTVANRTSFQPPYIFGAEDEVLYVKELILREGSIFNTAFNRIYYENLTFEPNAIITAEPLLGFSLSNIALDDLIEFLIRVRHNNYEDPHDPNNNRIHVERIEGSPPDPNGMMKMTNLLDANTGLVVNARAKGLFAKGGEDEILIRFEYIFGNSDPNITMAELVVSLSDSPELLELHDPNRLDHYIEVARLLPPPVGRYGSIGSDHFGIFERTVPTGTLNFVRGVRMELELIGPEGTYILINNWDPFVACVYCGDVTGDFAVSARDFLTVLGEFGQPSSGNNKQGQALYCLNSQFADDGYVGATDLMGWDWGQYMDSQGWISSFCFNLCMTPCSASKKAASATTIPPKAPIMTGGPAGFEGALLVSGKRYNPAQQDFMTDRLYGFDDEGNFVSGPFAMDNDRVNLKLVRDHAGELYQLNLQDGLVRISDQNSVIPRGAGYPINPDPRYGGSATVYVGFQDQGEDTWGRPVLDAAFDSAGYVYVTPVVVDAGANDPYVASAKLQLAPGQTPPYNVVTLYDDPPLPSDNQDANNLREIEVDGQGKVYIINSCYENNSDILRTYDSNGQLADKCELQGLGIYAPVGLCCSAYDSSRLYLGSSRGEPNANSPDANSASVHSLFTNDLTLDRSIQISNMGHITDVTEDPNSGTIWVLGFSMPQYVTTLPGNLSLIPQFYDPNLAQIPYDSNGPVSATSLADANDLALPLSIVWTVTTEKCGGADVDGGGTVNFDDFVVLADYWLDSNCALSNDCDGADLQPETAPDGDVDMADLAVLVRHWLDTGCSSP
ncbi:MAG: right-handed parallel beta-helix repeat-containing protein [Planctomycetota bacterium]|jgi:hypothetical protein